MSALPPAPQGLPPTLVVAKAIPTERRVGVAIACAVVYAALAAFTLWRGLSWPVAVPVFGCAYALTVVTVFGATLCAGDGWLGSSRHYVRTDRLVVLRARVNFSGMRVTMRDREGRSLYVRLSDLTIDPQLWQLVRAGVALSLASGLDADARSRGLFD